MPHNVHFRVTDDDFQKLKAAAEADGVTISDFCRRKILAPADNQTSPSPSVSSNDNLKKEITAWGVHLDQEVKIILDAIGFMLFSSQTPPQVKDYILGRAAKIIPEKEAARIKIWNILTQRKEAPPK